MKRLFAAVFFACFAAFAFAENDGEELDFLLFAPDSTDSFVNSEQGAANLDNLARYLLNRNPGLGQIQVHGYAATAKNDIDPVELSRARALFVISELQKRGLPAAWFAEPAAHGEVNLWGSNVTEDGKNLNRRVRILLDGNYLTQTAIVSVNEPAPKPAAAPRAESAFPWKILLLLLLLLALLCLLGAFILFARKRRKEDEHPAAPVQAAAHEKIVNLEEEIRRRAYCLYLARNGASENAEEDWHRAVIEISAEYNAAGWHVYPESGTWWASKTVYAS